MISSIGRYISGPISEQGRYNTATMDETGVYGESTQRPHEDVDIPLVSQSISILSVSYSYQQTVPVIVMLPVESIPAYAALYVVPTVGNTPTLIAPVGSPYQEYIGSITASIMMLEPFTSPFQQNMPLLTITSTTHNPTCYRPPLFAGVSRTTWTMTPTNKRFIRVGA